MRGWEMVNEGCGDAFDQLKFFIGERMPKVAGACAQEMMATASASPMDLRSGAPRLGGSGFIALCCSSRKEQSRAAFESRVARPLLYAGSSRRAGCVLA